MNQHPNNERAKAQRGMNEIHGAKSSGGSRRGNSAGAFLLLAPLNVLCIIVAALAVIGISSLARDAVSAPPTIDPAVTTGPLDVTEPPLVTDPIDTDAPPDTDGTTAVTTAPVTDKVTETVTRPPETEPVTEPVVEPVTEPVTSGPHPGVNPDRFPECLHPVYDIRSGLLGTSIVSDYAIIVDIEENRVVASRNSTVKMYPASMTKVMTLYVAALYIPEEDLYSKTYRMTNEIINPLYLANATRAGFEGGEDVLLIDYMYGTILPSGADCTVALSNYVAGSEEAFAELMNKTARELGLANTHFTNSTGLHDPDHYTTAYEMSVIMNAAMRNEVCRKVLSTYTYTTHVTPQHPSGITLYSTALVRLTPSNSSDLTFFAGKTGFTDEARQCLASVSRTADGKEYIMVTGHAVMKQNPVDDAVRSLTRLCVKN
ncbi:MAG: D-alanyl-D-alanine carboxypeptidase [Clostridia bacterium]|nr:D-alanyl-D-alanine carboxypeptidase [Clostridia bacterium]